MLCISASAALLLSVAVLAGPGQQASEAAPVDAAPAAPEPTPAQGEGEADAAREAHLEGPVDRGVVPLRGVTPGPTDLPLHSWERAEAAWRRQQQEMLAEEEEAEALAEQVRLLRQRRQPGSWAGRPELTARQAAALLAEELALRGDADVVDAAPAEETITSPPLMRRPAKKVRVKKVRREPDLAVVPQPHMLDAGAKAKAETPPSGATRVRRQHGPYPAGPSAPRPPTQRSAAVRDGDDGDAAAAADQDLDESRVKRHGHMGSTGPVHSFVKTDKHGHYKWGVRHHVGHHFA